MHRCNCCCSNGIDLRCSFAQTHGDSRQVEEHKGGLGAGSVHLVYEAQVGQLQQTGTQLYQ